MNVYLDESTDALYVDHGLGALTVLREDEPVTEAFALRGDWVELHTAEAGAAAVLDQVRAALADVKMSAKARAEVEAALDDLEPAES